MPPNPLVWARASGCSQVSPQPRTLFQPLSRAVWETSTTPYRFVILSESGRYIPPYDGSLYHEVLFYEPLAGKFKLLGFEEVNGGEAAKATGGRPPFGIF